MFKRILTLAITFIFANVLLHAQSDIKNCIVSKHQLKTVYNEKCSNFKKFEHISYNGKDMMLEYVDRIGSKELTQYCINTWSKLNTDGFENCYKDYLSKNGYISRDDYYKYFYYLEIISIFNSDLRSYHSANVKKSSDSRSSNLSNPHVNNQVEQYNNQESKRDDEILHFHQKTLQNTIKESKSYYSKVHDLITKYSGVILDFEPLLWLLEKSDPQTIISQYSKSLQNSEIRDLIEKLDANTFTIKNDYELQANKIVDWFYDHPNKVINGVYVTNSITDYEYNYASSKYEMTNLIGGISYVAFDTNTYQFIRSDANGNMKIGLFGFEKIVDGNYIFTDGLRGVVSLSKDFKTISFYYDRDLSTNWCKKKAVYSNIRKATADEIQSVTKK